MIPQINIRLYEDNPFKITFKFAGVAGPAGVGVPIGGVTGQVLAKASNTDYDTEWVTGGSGSGTFVALTDTPNSYVSENGKIVRVNSSSNGLEFVTLDKTLVGLGNVDNTSDLNKPISTATQAALDLKEDSLGFTPEDVSNKATNLVSPDNTKYPTTLAVSTGLSGKEDSLGFTPENVSNKENTTIDTSTTKYPTVNLLNTGLSGKQDADQKLDSISALDYTSNALKFVRVNAGENNFELVSFTGGVTTFTGLTDTPSAYTGQAGRLVRVNSFPDGLEFIDPTPTLVGLSNVPNVDATARANHTGTQLASTISDFNTAASSAAPVQSVNAQTGIVSLDADDISDAATTNKFTTASDISKLAGIESGADVTDEANVISSLNGATIGNVTVTGTDKVLIQDASDSDNLKTVTAQSIADLAPAGSDELVKVSSNDSTAKYLEDAIVVSSGTNSTNVLEISTLNDGGNEDVQIQFDVSKVDLSQANNTTSDFISNGDSASLDSSGAGDTLTVDKSGTGDAVVINNSGSGNSLVVNTNELVVNSSGNVTASGTITASNLSGTNTGDQDLSGYELLSNKSDNTSLGTSTTLYPTQNAVKSYVDTGLSGKEDSLGFTPEDVANKSDNTALGTSITLYPTQNAVKSYVDTGLGTKQDTISGAAISTASVADADKFLFQDASDADNLKTDTFVNLKDNILDAVEERVTISCSDELSDLTVATGVVTLRMPFAMILTEVRASVTTAPTGSTLIVDINEGGVSILSTKLSIDATEKTSTTAAVPVVISDAALADDAEITIDIDQVGSTITGTGLKITLIGTRQ